MIILMILLIRSIYQAHEIREEIAVKERHRFNSSLLAKELFQSSEDLTRMARSYVVTGNPEYKDYFLTILAIRNGQIPRPYDNPSTYWYLEGINKQPDSKQGQAIALLKLLKNEGITHDELHLLQQSLQHSDQLVQIEQRAFAAVEGRHDNGQGEYILHGEPDFELAIKLLWGDEYNNKKTKIMLPLKQFMTSINDRTIHDIELAYQQLNEKTRLEYFLLTAFLLSIIGSAAFIRRRILRPIRELTIETERFTNGDYSSRCTFTGANEVDALGSTLNLMAETIERIIKDHQTALQLLRESELNLIGSQHMAHIGNWEHDLKTGEMRGSDELFRLLEIAPTEHSIPYETFLTVIHPEDRNKVKKAHGISTGSSDNPNNISYRLQMPDGQIKWVNEFHQTIYDATGEPVFSQGTVQDISTQKQMELTLDQRIFELNERVKELNCLNQLADLQQDSSRSLENFFDQAVHYLPPAWNHPELVSARIVFNGKKYQSGECPNHAHKMCAPIILDDKQCGEIEIFHQQTIPEHHEAAGNPFLAEEYRLLDTVAHQISQHAAHKKAQDTVHLYASVFEHSGESILIIDPQSRIIAANAAFYKLTGYTQKDVLFQDAKSLLFEESTSKQYQELLKALYTENFWQGEISTRHQNGLLHVVWLSVSGIRDQHNKIEYYIASFTDITEYRAAIDKINYLAHHDTLTDLPNRFALIERLDQAMSIAKRNQEKIAVMFIDLDRFKPINDTLGHHIGDQLLIQVAKRLKFSVRNSDIVARLGGDEFVVALLELENSNRVFNVADKILRNLGQPYNLEEHTVHSSPSIGIALFPDDGDHVEILMKNADTAMYHAKSQDRNNYKFFETAMNDESQERQVLEQEMHSALARNEFILFYQPKIDIETSRVYGVEALLRWQHPVKDLIPPSLFVPLAEESGLILPLGEWVLRNACRQLVEWRSQGIKNIQFSINLSQRQLRQPNFSKLIASIIDAEKIDPAFLEFEITESMVMSDPQSTLQSLKLLHDIGVKISLDDFGTGYSSISYLKQFPIDCIKLDRSYVKDIGTDPNDATICAGTITLASNLGLDVVAEGVETETQYNYLKRLNCSKIQGYHFCKPLPAEETKTYIKNFNLAYLPSVKPKHQANILIIDDDKFTCHFHADILENLGYIPKTAMDPIEGLELLRQNPGLYEFVMLDMLMPKMSGVDMINEIRTINPLIPIAIISGHKADAIRKTLKPKEKEYNLLYGINYFIIEKPIKIESLKILLSKIFP